MSIASIVTRGYGSFGSVNKLPTLGYSISVTDTGEASSPWSVSERGRVYRASARGRVYDAPERGRVHKATR